MSEARYDSFHIGGYWWALSVRDGDETPEVIHVGGRGADRLTGEADPYDIREFLPLAPIDTKGWPGEGSPALKDVGPGYYWAFVGDEDVPEILRVVDEFTVYRWSKDGEDAVANVDAFLVKIEPVELSPG